MNEDTELKYDKFICNWTSTGSTVFIGILNTYDLKLAEKKTKIKIRLVLNEEVITIKTI